MSSNGNTEKMVEGTFSAYSGTDWCPLQCKYCWPLTAWGP